MDFIMKDMFGVIEYRGWGFRDQLFLKDLFFGLFIFIFFWLILLFQLYGKVFFERSREIEYSIRLYYFLQLLRILFQDILSFEGLQVKVVKRFKLERRVCVCLYVLGCVFILYFLRLLWCLSYYINYCEQQGFRKRL